MSWRLMAFCVTVGGGFGLLLRTRMVAERGAATLSEARLPARSTGDIDCFLSVDVITDGGKTQAVRNAIDALGYSPKPNAKNFQFVRSIDVYGQPREIGIDLLTGPIPAESLVVKRTSRVRPVKARGLHAYLTAGGLCARLRYAAGQDRRWWPVDRRPDPASVRILDSQALRLA
ncbi:MAG: hypothetical protein IPN16_23790 [Gemmatimonadetes bacterium]|nr:hypothetical protein [Gemmatimonadota bacterium]